VNEFYNLHEANARLTELRETMLRLIELRGDVVKLRDRILELDAPALANGPITLGGPVPAARTALPPADASSEEAQRLMLRMKGLIDQMEAAVAQIDGWNIQLREIGTGLVDFPALVSGRPVWLCWRLGEDKIEWWHEFTEGFDTRKRIEDLV